MYIYVYRKGSEMNDETNFFGNYMRYYKPKGIIKPCEVQSEEMLKLRQVAKNFLNDAGEMRLHKDKRNYYGVRTSIIDYDQETLCERLLKMGGEDIIIEISSLLVVKYKGWESVQCVCSCGRMQPKERVDAFIQVELNTGYSFIAVDASIWDAIPSLR